ncbi:hypothetical protein L9F63_015036, partial [Diploptera punctata]
MPIELKKMRLGNCITLFPHIVGPIIHSLNWRNTLTSVGETDPKGQFHQQSYLCCIIHSLNWLFPVGSISPTEVTVLRQFSPFFPVSISPTELPLLVKPTLRVNFTNRVTSVENEQFLPTLGTAHGTIGQYLQGFNIREN